MRILATFLFAYYDDDWGSGRGSLIKREETCDFMGVSTYKLIKIHSKHAIRFSYVATS